MDYALLTSPSLVLFPLALSYVVYGVAETLYVKLARKETPKADSEEDGRKDQGLDEPFAVLDGPELPDTAAPSLSKKGEPL